MKKFWLLGMMALPLAFWALMASGAMAQDESLYKGHESEEMGPATSSHEYEGEEMTPAVPGQDQWNDEEMTPSGSLPKEGSEEMTPAGSGFKEEEYDSFRFAPYRIPANSQPGSPY
ncbi:MAG TPA: hypothetical protein VEL68_17600 [Thermodesulfobacteriota bacterium]|nr:hypothetical protein [Thermodesulfobacteriota bacterium]